MSTILPLFHLLISSVTDVLRVYSSNITLDVSRRNPRKEILMCVTGTHEAKHNADVTVKGRFTCLADG
jgi:hypothetical protein